MRASRLALLLLVELIVVPRQAATQSIEDRVEVALYELVESSLPWEGATFHLSDVRLMGDAPTGDWWLELPDNANFRSRLRVRLVADGQSRPIWVLANLEVDVPVVVAARAIPSGARVEGYTMVEILPLSSLPQGFVSDEAAVRGFVTRRALRQGDPVRSHYLERPIVMERNEVVMIIVQRGHVTATDRGIALEPGREGEPIRVRSLSSENVLTAVVLGEGRVEVP